MAFVYRAEVEELRVLRREELPGLDVIETSRPIVDACLYPPSEPFLK